MIHLKEKSKLNIHWNVSPYDFSKEKSDSIVSKASIKYHIPKEKIKVIPNFTIIENGNEDIMLAKDVIQNIQDPQFQIKLFNDYLNVNNITDFDFDIIKQIDSEINANIDYQIYDKYRRYSIKWIRWDNFMSYGADNYINFEDFTGLVLLNGEPSNESGKSTLSIDLIHFLLFGSTSRFKTQDKLFNKHITEATKLVVEGCISIDGCDYIIKRTLTRPSIENRTDKSKATQKVEYYRITGDNLERLDDFIDNQQEENSIQTNKVIKEAIGKESDFDMIMCVTESTLDELIDKKETERGRLLSRWIGLLPIELKDSIARERFNSEIKPRLLSNQFNEETLRQEISAYEANIKNLKSEIKNLSKSNSALEKELEALERKRNTLLASKRDIDDGLLKIDIATLKAKIERNITDGKMKSGELSKIESEISSIKDAEFSVEEYDEMQEKLTKVSNEIAVIGEKYKNIERNINHLKSSEICPTCHRKLDNVDNSARIAELELELKTIVNDGKIEREKETKLKKIVENLKEKRELYVRKNQLIVKKSAIEVNIERLRNEYKENMSLKKEYDKNSDAIDFNNRLDIELRNTSFIEKSKRAIKEENSSSIARNELEINNNKEQINNRLLLIEKIKKENILVKNWKIYLELVGKNGIAKMVLRKTLPIINAKLSQLLGDVCDFNVEVGINQKNDVMFYLVKDGVYSDLFSGSGYERTASALALRAVLSDMSTIPKMNGVVWDEIFGRVARENYENIKTLIHKISQSYDWVFIISHNEEIKDWCDKTILVKKENNISKLYLE